MARQALLRVLVAVVTLVPLSAVAAETSYEVGLAQVDITPDYPIRLSGFGHRRTESEGITQRIRAKAMAIKDANGTSLLLAVDLVGVPDYMTRDLAARLEKKAKFDPTRLAVTATHTHTAPMVSKNLATMFGSALPPDQQERIDRYTREVSDKLEEVSLAALKVLEPAKLEVGCGSVGFAINRRTKGGPVDHDLPVMFIRDPSGKLRGVYTSYACHCVTLSHNKISGDWAGYEQELIEKAHPGVLCLTSIGCGADQNPDSNPVGDRVDIAEAQAKQIAVEVDRLMKQGLSPLTAPIATKLNRIALPFDKHPTREQWAEVAKRDDYAGYHAKVNLAKLERGEKLQTELEYPIQTWTFGDQLAMVFLPGEVVVDYSLRLKRDFDRSRLWLNAYSNDVPCYIPSERILREGGYEAYDAMIFYDRPARLATGVEQKIIDEVHRQLPKEFVAPKGTEGVAPKSPQQSLNSIRTKDGLEVELVASEPLIVSPVAIDWGADGRLWVCEMFDYPTGTDGAFAPGGRVKVLSDSDGDGKYDTDQIFLENIPFPTGVTAWGKGVFVCAAPDVLYAQDTDGDGKADKVEKIFSGFGTDNYQARVNSLSIGLDNWIYGAGGLLGGKITSAHGEVEIRNNDFRFRPMNGPMESAAGTTQYGRARDDFGRWFGCDNSRPLFYYPYESRYLRRNPHAPGANPVVTPKADYDAARVYPISRTLERFNDPTNVNRFTSAGGLGIYRDTLLGDEFYGNAFVTESVHNLVHRMILGDDGKELTRYRAKDESESEFLASSDNWFRPVQVRTGPDGALYVVDIYRFLIEHPRWIPAERLAQLDVRAGADKGRIYRVVAKGKQLRAVKDLSKMSPAELAAAMDSPNGTERDRVHVELLARKDAGAAAELSRLAASAKLPQVRVQALSVLAGLDALTKEQVIAALKDEDGYVRAAALRLSEPMLGDEAVLGAVCVTEGGPRAGQQLAYTLGESADPRAGKALASLVKSMGDARLRVAVLSSAKHHCGVLLPALMAVPGEMLGRSESMAGLIATAAASGDDDLLTTALSAIGDNDFAALTSLLDARGEKPLPAKAQTRVAEVQQSARVVAGDAKAADAQREAALRVLGRGNVSADDVKLLCDIVANPANEPVRAAALEGLRRQQDPQVADRLLATWPQASPHARAELAGLLISRDAWAAALLTAIKKRQIQANEIALADRQRLSENTNEQVRALATEVLPMQTSSSRAGVLARYVSVASLTGSVPRGAELFTKNCAACHALNGIGREIGPDLAALRGKDADYFVKNVLDPSAVVEPRFVNYVVTMKDGRTLSGIITAETATNLTLAAGGNATVENLSRNDIKSIRATSISMMPEGFEAAMPPELMADLVAFLKSGAKPKQLPGNTPKLIEPGKDGSLVLGAANAEIYGGSIVLESEFKNIGYWSGADDHVVWQVRVAKAGDYDVHIDYACESASAGNKFIVEAAGRTVKGTVAATGPDWSTYKRVRVGSIKLDAGPQRVVFRADGPVRGSLIDLRTVALTAPGTQPKWPASATAPASEDFPRDPAGIARLILDGAKPQAARQAAVEANPQYASELIAEMTKDLAPGMPAEYERIPWIWRVSIAAGKRNDAVTIKRILDVSLPQMKEPLRDWQAVVIGGGIINGISQRNVWPGDRIEQIITEDDEPLKNRWQRALNLAAAMADDAKVPAGTRHDALRMLGVEPWDERGAQLTKYLKDANAELQMGAVSGIVDVNSPVATEALINAIPKLTEGNRNLALDGLFRDPSRAHALLDAIEEKRIDPKLLGEARITRMKDHSDDAVRKRAAEASFE